LRRTKCPHGVELGPRYFLEPVSTPEQNCIGLPEQKYISDAGKKAPRTGGLPPRLAACEYCSGANPAAARHFVALATYMGHADMAHTYWYLEATPELMTDIAAAAEALIAGAAP
jgi:hypothetical protein